MSINLAELDEVSNLLLDIEVRKLSALNEKLLDLDLSISALKLSRIDQGNFNDVSNRSALAKYQTWMQLKATSLNFEKANLLADQEIIQTRARQALGRVEAIQSMILGP